MEVERENISRNNIEWYLNFIRNYGKEEEEEEKDNIDKRLAKSKRGKGNIQHLLVIAIAFIRKT